MKNIYTLIGKDRGFIDETNSSNEILMTMYHYRCQKVQQLKKKENSNFLLIAAIFALICFCRNCGLAFLLALNFLFT